MTENIPPVELTLDEESALLTTTVFPPDEFPDPSQAAVDLGKDEEVQA